MRAGTKRILTGAVALALQGGAAAMLHAQEALLGPGAAFVSVGISGLDTGALDDRLTAQGYPTFGQRAGTLGIGAYRLLSNRWMLGFEGQGLIIGEEEHLGREVELAGGYATLGVGYAIALSPRLRVYSRIGIGAGGFSVVIENPADTVQFDDVLDDPQPVTDSHDPILSRDGVVLDVGGGIEFLSGRRGGGALIGLRAGYLAAPFDSSWDLVYHGTAAGGPDATISGFYIRMIIGGGWRR